MEFDKSDIWTSFSMGDEKSLKSIYDQHYEMLVNYGYKFTNNQTIIEDTIQSLFIKLWRNRSNLKKPVSLKHYLLKAFRNTLISNMQAASREAARKVTFESIPFQLELSPDDNIINQEEAYRNSQILKGRMSNLTNRQREAVHLRFYQELSYEEVAEVLKMNIEGAYKLIYRAIDRLRTEK